MADLREFQGVDVHADGIMDRPWSWFLGCIAGVMSTAPQWLAVTPSGGLAGSPWLLAPVYRTRCQRIAHGDPDVSVLTRANAGTA